MGFFLSLLKKIPKRQGTKKQKVIQYHSLGNLPFLCRNIDQKKSCNKSALVFIRKLMQLFLLNF